LILEVESVYITIAMPNQRAKNKALIGAFVDAQLKARVTHLAHSTNTTASDIVGKALQHYLDTQARQVPATAVDDRQTPVKATDPRPEENVEEIWLL
jgi:hypothetical protein